MSDRQTPKYDMHTSNHDGSAARGAQYRDDQPAGVDNSQQAAQGCRVAAGATGRRADTCPLGTADSSKDQAHESDPVPGQGILDLLWARRSDVFGKTGKLPSEFTLTPEEFDRLRAEVTPATSYAVFNPGDSSGYMVFGIPVRIAGSADGR